MLKSTQKVETNRYRFEIEIGPEEFAAAVDKAFAQNAKRISVPGFRKGKAPRAVIEKRFGAEIFYEDAFNLLYPDAVEEAVKASGLEVIDDKVDFDLVSMNKENGVLFNVTMTVKPDAEVGEYKGLKVTRPSEAVDESEVDAEIERLRDRNSRLVSVEDRPAREGDTAVIDFEGFLDGTAFEGGSAQGQSLKLGSGMFIPGFEEQIVGHSAGEEFEINVTFPEDYGSAELAGKAAVFKIKLHEIKETQLPEADDEFAKDVSEFDTLEELRADFRRKLSERKTQAADKAVENQLMDRLAADLKAEIPGAMIERRIDETVRDFEYRLRSQGLELATYLKYMGQEAESFREGFRENAEKHVKIRLALEKIAKLENIEVTEEELEAEYARYAENWQTTPENIKSAVPADDLKEDLAVRKAMDLVKSAAVVESAEAAAKPAKKTRAKKAETAEETEDKPKKSAGRKSKKAETESAE